VVHLPAILAILSETLLTPKTSPIARRSPLLKPHIIVGGDNTIDRSTIYIGENNTLKPQRYRLLHGVCGHWKVRVVEF